MARQDSTSRSRAGRHRWHIVSDARSRLRMVRSGRGDRPWESPYRPEQPALRDGPAGAFGRAPDLALTGLNMATPMSQAEPEPAPKPSRPVMSSCPQCSAALAVLRFIPGLCGAVYSTMRCTRCGVILLDI